MPLHIIHSADWHLGQTFFGYDREVEHDAFLEWLGDTLTQRQTDVLLIAGDIFDVANPSATAQRRFYRFLRETSRRNPGLQTVIIAGNHDSAVRLEAPVPLLEEMNTVIVGLVKRKEEGGIDFDSLVFPLCDRTGNRKAWCLAVPFLRQGDYPPSEEEQEDTYIAGVGRMYARLVAYAAERRTSGEALLAMGHLHATGAELSDDDRSERVIMGGLESVPVDAFSSDLAYTALGHIHKAQRVGGRENVRYAGSPLPMSFSEKNYRHQVVEVVLENEEVVSIEPLDIPLTARLMRVPEQPASPAEVLEKLASLPDAGSEAADSSRWPYVEIRVLLCEPDPGFRHRVEEALEGKAVRLTSIVPSYLQRQGEEAEQPLASRDLRKIDPADMVRQAFAAKYGCELPAEMEELFNEVMREVSL